jgi:hypothetical protein
VLGVDPPNSTTGTVLHNFPAENLPVTADGGVQNIARNRSLAVTRDCCGQGKTDTQLSNPSKFLIFIGTDIPEIRVLPSAVVEHLDVSDNIVARLLTRGVIMVRRPLTF